MRLLTVEIQNFKSLRSVSFKPGGLSVVIGPNGAGKSNLCEALDFIGEMYRWGLELAVNRHGGYENICYRYTRRSKSPIKLTVTAKLSPQDTILNHLTTSGILSPVDVTVEHTISFRASSQKVQSPFSIINESIDYRLNLSKNGDGISMLQVERSGNDLLTLRLSETIHEYIPSFFREETLNSDFFLRGDIKSTESIVRLLDFFLVYPVRSVGLIDAYQLNPAVCRSSSAPTPNSRLERDGSNLPGIIERLKIQKSAAFDEILDTLRAIMPSLESIDVAITPQRTLGLTFRERGFGRPWTAEDVSDGTIRALGLLAALFDTSSDVAIIEEPENSLHPWAIGQFVEACRVASELKQIILTTHSPTLINHLKPEEIWVVSKLAAETDVQRLVDLDPDAEIGWAAGKFTLAEYIDSGIVPQAVPGTPA